MLPYYIVIRLYLLAEKENSTQVLSGLASILTRQWTVLFDSNGKRNLHIFIGIHFSINYVLKNYQFKNIVRIIKSTETRKK